jgi:mannose/fructose/N-acetylgalactosamine-specific phosphotransferase system component IIC
VYFSRQLSSVQVLRASMNTMSAMITGNATSGTMIGTKGEKDMIGMMTVDMNAKNDMNIVTMIATIMMIDMNTEEDME